MKPQSLRRVYDPRTDTWAFDDGSGLRTREDILIRQLALEKANLIKMGALKGTPIDIANLNFQAFTGSKLINQ